MQKRSCYVLVALLVAATTVSSALAGGTNFTTLYSFEAPAPVTYASPLGSQPDTRPVLGPGPALYGMTYYGGENGTGVVYRFDLRSQQYTVLHVFGALNAYGDNADGAYPGVALTLGPDGVFYGMASLGGASGNGTIFKITASGDFSVVHTFSALDANGHNVDGAYPLRTIVIGTGGNLYGTTRLGGENTCGPVAAGIIGCGVVWVMDPWGKNFRVLHQFTAAEGHAASIIQASDGLLYGSAVWPYTMSSSGAILPSGILFRMATSGQNFTVLYNFTQTNVNGDNMDGADPYEPLLEAEHGVFYGSAFYGGANGNGVVFRYCLANPGVVDVVHDFSTTTNGYNGDGANPNARLTPGPGGWLYSTASYGGANANGVIYRLQPNGAFQLLYTFSSTNPTTGANDDGATPDFGVVVAPDKRSLFGMADYGGNGSSSGPAYSGGTLYEFMLGN